MKKKNLLVVEPGFRTHKEFLVQSLVNTKKVNLFFAKGLSEIVDYSWVKKYGKGEFDFSYSDNNLTQEIDRFQKKKKIKFSGIITWIDTSTHFVNEAQKNLSLPFISELNGKNIRNKSLVRELLRTNLVDDTWFATLRSYEDLKKLNKESLKFPLILKPTEMMASLGVHKVHCFDDIRNKLEETLNIDFTDEDLRKHYGDIASEAILETFLDGTSYSVESMVINSNTKILGIHEKETKGVFITGDVLSPKMSTQLETKIHSFIHKVHGSLKIQNSFTHIELKVIKGEPKLLEVNCRIGGDYIPFNLHQKGKVDLGNLLIATAFGEGVKKNPLKPSPRYARYYTCDEPGRVIRAPSFLKKSNILEQKHYFQSGELVIPNTENEVCYLGHVVSTARDRKTVSNNEFFVQKPLYTMKNKNHNEILVFGGVDSDLKKIIEIESETWTIKQAASNGTCKKRLLRNPARYFIAYDKSTRQPYGFIYWVPVSKEECVGALNWDFYNSNQVMQRDDTQFNYRHIVSISVKPEAPSGVGTALLNAATAYCRNHEIHEYRYGLRIPNYHRYSSAGIDISTYLKMLKNGDCFEEGYKMALNSKSKLIQPLAEYYDDPASRNYALLFSNNIKVSK